LLKQAIKTPGSWVNNGLKFLDKIAKMAMVEVQKLPHFK